MVIKKAQAENVAVCTGRRCRFLGNKEIEKIISTGYKPWDKVKRHRHLKCFPPAKSSGETNVQAAFCPSWSGDRT